MTYTFKLSRRLAGLRTVWAALLVGSLACADQPATGPADAADLVAVAISPHTLTLELDQSAQFTAVGRTADGDSLAVELDWAATGGTIDSSGRFTATAVGEFKVAGRGRGHKNPSDTSDVIVVPPQPTLVEVIVTPATATLQADSGQQFTAIGKLSDSSTVQIGVTWSATGGGIDASGYYQAGDQSGTYHVIATNTAGTLADTATVTITAPPASTLTQVFLVPATVALAAGATQEFAAYGRNSAGDSVAVTVTYTATGGTITSAGLYTAGTTAGQYQVIASAGAGAPADTSSVTISPPSGDSEHAGYYVAPTGSSTAAGTQAAPWSLAHALSHPSAVQPGDTIWVRGGTYRGCFTGRLTGTASAPVVLRAYPGERATLDGAGCITLRVDGAYAVYWGLEIINGVVGVNAFGDQVRFVNLAVHDNRGQGIGFWSAAEGGEVYGSLIYNNGSATNLDHGIYAQNLTGTKTLANNVIFHNFAYGIHVYGGDGPLRGFQIAGNTLWDNGAIDPTRASAPNLLVGGGTAAERISVLDNLAYYSRYSGPNLRLGYGAANRDVVLRGNYAVGGAPVMRFWDWATAQVSGNTFIGTGAMLDFTGPTTGQTWGGNTWYRDPATLSWDGLTLAGWQAASGLASTDQATSAKPSGVKVVVRPNTYERGRAHVTVYNWSGAATASADLSGVLALGQAYEIRNAQTYYAAPVLRGTYQGGTVALPMAPVTATAPTGAGTVAPPSTGTTFHTFVVLPK